MTFLDSVNGIYFLKAISSSYCTVFVFISNIDAQFLFTGSRDEFWFYAVTWQLEMDAVPGIKVS
jgi:hypothetical protein